VLLAELHALHDANIVIHHLAFLAFYRQAVKCNQDSKHEIMTAGSSGKMAK